MFEITNTPLPYTWGSRTLMAEFRGTVASGSPEAELWFGDHHSSPASRVDDGRSIIDWQKAARQPAFPFLVKILAVDQPLSLQVHPTKTLAEQGFARERRERVPADSPHRNFKDTNHKPEAIIALSEFRAFVGFSPPDVHEPIFARLNDLGVAGVGALTKLPRDEAWPLDSVVGIEHLTELSDALRLGVPGLTDDSAVDRAVARAIDIARRFPNDSSAALTLVLNYCVLAPGDVLFVPAGTIHAYLSGLGLEIMATSDNVLRAGMTTKHIDIPALIESLSTTPTSNPMMTPLTEEGVEQFRPPVDDFLFDVVAVDGPREYSIPGPAIVVAIDGDVSLAGQQILPLRRGSAAVIERGESVVQVFGHGKVVVVSSAKPHRRRPWFNR